MSTRKSSGKKNDKSEAEVIAKLQDELKQAKLRIESLERLLVLRSEQTQRARSEQEEMRDKLRQLDEDFEKEKVERFNIASDMIRQYKSMQETMIGRVNDSERKRANLKDQLALAKHALDETKKEKDQVIEMKNKEIEALKQKMEDMVVEFEHMLKETLSKMGNTISEAQKQDDHDIAEELSREEKIRWQQSIDK